MPADIEALKKLEVPVIVLLGRRQLPVKDVVSLVPGAIIELPKSAEDELELLCNNKVIGTGRAVKVGENFGLRLSYVGDLRRRLEALRQAGEGSTPEVAPTALDAALSATV
jgi:flagellar motor switch protein FliN/FliY